MRNIAARSNFEFYNANKLGEFTDDMFVDSSHLNEYGAKIYTSIILENMALIQN